MNCLGCHIPWVAPTAIEFVPHWGRVTHAMEYKPAPNVTPQDLIRVRKSLSISRALFAAYLRTNVRIPENWEQGRAKPNAQAALLINLVKRYPDTVQRLASI